MAEVEYWQPGEEDEFTEFCRTAEKWGWQWAVFTRGDINSRLDHNITDEEWELVLDSRLWGGLGEAASDWGAESICSVIEEVFPDE